MLAEGRVDCVFDVGANEGQYAEMIRGLGYRGPIVSFEPIPSLAARLREKAARGQAWFVEEVALDSEEREVVFNVMADSQFSSLHPPSDKEVDRFRSETVITQALTVTTGRLDVLFAKYKAQLGFSRPFLKMDTQGNDIGVAMGAGDCLGAFVGLQSELGVKRIYESQPTYREAIDFYEAHGFQLSAFVPNNTGHFPELIETDCIMFNPAMFGAAPASGAAGR
jgi:FkbM family methyltransferase